MTESTAEIARKLKIAWRFFSARDYVDGFGHISARTQYPAQNLITPHSLRPDSTSDSTPEDFVVVDLDGNQPDSDAKLPGELPIHLEIYKARPDVGSIAYLHCPFATSFSMSEHDLKPTYFLAAIFRDGVPVHLDARLVLTEERSKALAETLGPHRAALMRAHGIVVTGPDLVEMTAGVFILEDNARRTAIAASMGAFETLRDAEMAEIEAEILASRHPLVRVWSMCEEVVSSLDTSKADACSTSVGPPHLIWPFTSPMAVAASLAVMRRWCRPGSDIANFLERQVAKIHVPVEEGVVFRTIGIFKVSQSWPDQKA